MTGRVGLLPPGLFAELPGTGALYASRRWSVQSSGAGARVPLFSARGRSALDVWAQADPSASASASSANEVYILHAYGVGGDLRREVARSVIRSGFSGRALSVRDLLLPEVQVELEVYDPGSYPQAWRFACASWGREPSHAEVSDFRSCRQTNAPSASGPAVLISDCGVSLDWLEFSLVASAGESNLWAQLWDTSVLDGPPSFTTQRLRAQWPVRLGDVDVGLSRSVTPRRPLQLYDGAYLVLSTTPDGYSETPAECQLWAHWQTHPTLQLPWRRPPTIVS